MGERSFVRLELAVGVPANALKQLRRCEHGAATPSAHPTLNGAARNGAILAPPCRLTVPLRSAPVGVLR